MDSTNFRVPPRPSVSSDYTPKSPRVVKQKSRGRKRKDLPLIIAFVIIFLLGLGFGLYFLLRNKL